MTLDQCQCCSYEHHVCKDDGLCDVSLLLLGLLIVISVAVFGAKFRGHTPYLPYGWSYWLAVVSAFLFLVNGFFVWFVAVSVRRKDKLSPLKMYAMRG
jgi:hypothetical protein